MKEKITKRLYDRGVQREWSRLVKDEFHKLELNTTLHFLKKYLPKRGLILDAGGGPGRYSIELAKEGHNLVLFDLSQKNLDFAREMIAKEKVANNIKKIIQGSIVNLSQFKDNSFDAVICLGNPLGHISSEKARLKVTSELTRVAKKNSPIFVSVIGRLSVIQNSPQRFSSEIKMTRHFFNFALKGEDHHWHTGEGYSHMFLIEELESLFDKKKVKILERVGLEGLASRDNMDKIFKDRIIKRNWMNMHFKLCTHPSVVDISEHMMIIVRKK